MVNNVGFEEKLSKVLNQICENHSYKKVEFVYDGKNDEFEQIAFTDSGIFKNSSRDRFAYDVVHKKANYNIDELYEDYIEEYESEVNDLIDEVVNYVQNIIQDENNYKLLESINNDTVKLYFNDSLKQTLIDSINDELSDINDDFNIDFISKNDELKKLVKSYISVKKLDMNDNDIIDKLNYEAIYIILSEEYPEIWNDLIDDFREWFIEHGIDKSDYSHANNIQFVVDNFKDVKEAINSIPNKNDFIKSCIRDYHDYDGELVEMDDVFYVGLI